MGFLLTALTLFPASSRAGDNLPKRRPDYSSKISRISCITTLVIASAILPSTLPGVYHNKGAVAEGKVHIGSGIYFRMDDVRKNLNQEELDLIAKPKGNPLAVVELFNQKLSGNYGDWGFYPVVGGRDATEFLCTSGSDDRGVCRHKARILAAILNDLGIRAELQSGTHMNAPYRWHVWVYIPELGVVADPTENTIIDADIYHNNYSVTVDGIPLPAGWY